MSDVAELGRSPDHALVDPTLSLLGRRLRRGRNVSVGVRGGRSCVFLGVFVPHGHLLEELGGFGFGGEGETDHAFISWEGMEKGPILIICDIFDYFVLPNDSSRAS